MNMNVKNDNTNAINIYANAFTTIDTKSNSNCNNIVQPATNNIVKIVDFSSQNRGNGLIATKSISRGDIIYTEKAAIVTQLPNHNNNNIMSCTNYSLWTVRACQYCFRSLEPASSCEGLFADNNNNNHNEAYDCHASDTNVLNEGRKNYNMDKESSRCTLPRAYLWPVPTGIIPYASARKVNSKTTTDTLYQDEFGHYRCCTTTTTTTTTKTNECNNNSKNKNNNIKNDEAGCGSLFCSPFCHQKFQQELGSCCQVIASMKAYLELLHVKKGENNAENTATATSDNYYHVTKEVDNTQHKELEEEQRNDHLPGEKVCVNDIDNESDNDIDEPILEVQAPVVLSIRIFALSLQHFRTNNNSFVGFCLDGLCGQSTDITPLELGWIQEKKSKINNFSHYSYTLKPLYNQFKSIWTMTKIEEKEFSLEKFEQMASVAARNGIGFRTQNPFDVYYSALIRSIGGRNSVNHSAVMAQVSCALQGRSSLPSTPPAPTTTTMNDETKENFGGLRRGMDSLIRERVTPEVVAIFPLTARINHSCQPSAYIASQSFVDAHIDLIAERDIASGEEITISYIFTGQHQDIHDEGNVIQRRQGSNKPRHKRQRELQAKYLFLCSCPLCGTSNTSSASSSI